MSNSVLKKIVYFVRVRLVSPLCISEGDGILTDSDVLRNGEGNPFIPGSSLAGAMRAYLDKEKFQECIFGYEDMSTNKGRMSSLFISDLCFEGGIHTTVRDSVALSNKKTTISGAKFDMEVVDTGAEGSFWMELVIREKDDEIHLLEQLQAVLAGWKEREIRFGSKKSRGYGEVQILSVKEKVFDRTNILEYGNAYSDVENGPEGWTDMTFEGEGETSRKYVTISLPLKLEGGISIRQYAVKKEEPDFVHITANGKPVIPGTSFSGAIRHRLSDILEELGVSNTEQIVDEIFGYVKKNGKESTARVSNVVIGECVLENSQKLTMVRNGISRFESGAKDGALFKELSYVGGYTVLEIKVKKTGNLDKIIGLLLLVLKDVQNGFLAVGGQTAVGRGLFSANGNIAISSECTQEQYLAAAADMLVRG